MKVCVMQPVCELMSLCLIYILVLCLYVRIYIYVYMCMVACSCVCMRAFMCAYIYACLCKSIYVFSMYVYMCMCVNMCVWFWFVLCKYCLFLCLLVPIRMIRPLFNVRFRPYESSVARLSVQSQIGVLFKKSNKFSICITLPVLLCLLIWTGLLIWRRELYYTVFYTVILSSYYHILSLKSPHFIGMTGHEGARNYIYFALHFFRFLFAVVRWSKCCCEDLWVTLWRLTDSLIRWRRGEWMLNVWTTERMDDTQEVPCRYLIGSLMPVLQRANRSRYPQ